jgi:hypothetical protein
MAYTPPPASLGRLGAITALLAQTTPIDKDISKTPKIFATLPGGQIFFDTDLELDTDGWPDGFGSGDTSHQADTNLHCGGNPINAAFDLDIAKIKAMGLKAFWTIAARHGFLPILDKPDIGANEAWHFDCRGSHQLVYDYYKAGKGGNFKSPYAAMAASGIVSIGVKVEALGQDPKPAYVQSGLIRLGKTIGGMDGDIGTKSKTALGELGIDAGQPVDAIAAAVDVKLQAKFPDEFATPSGALVA